MHSLPDCHPDTFNYDFELGLRHVARLRRGESLGGHGANALGRLEHRVVDLELLFVPGLLALPALKLAGNLVRPPFQAGVDGLQVHA